MLKESVTYDLDEKADRVLILILMEHAQRVFNNLTDEEQKETVLILILMEHAQRVRYDGM